MPDGFHAAFRAALAGDPSALAPWAAGPAAAAGLSVHCNSIAKGCADALVAQFPTVERVVGRDWLAAAAVAYARTHPPRRASLLDYGDRFPAWIAAFPLAAGMPYLAGLAQLDWLCACADLAADAPALAPSRLAALAPEDFAVHALDLHPATRFAFFEDSTPDLWLALQAPEARDLELDDAPQGLAFLRPGPAGRSLVLSRGSHAFLAAIESGADLASAAGAALTAEPSLDLAASFAELVAAGAFSNLRNLT